MRLMQAPNFNLAYKLCLKFWNTHKNVSERSNDVLVHAKTILRTIAKEQSITEKTLLRLTFTVNA